MGCSRYERVGVLKSVKKQFFNGWFKNLIGKLTMIVSSNEEFILKIHFNLTSEKTFPASIGRKRSNI